MRVILIYNLHRYHKYANVSCALCVICTSIFQINLTWSVSVLISVWHIIQSQKTAVVKYWAAEMRVTHSRIAFLLREGWLQLFYYIIKEANKNNFLLVSQGIWLGRNYNAMTTELSFLHFSAVVPALAGTEFKFFDSGRLC